MPRAEWTFRIAAHGLLHSALLPLALVIIAHRLWIRRRPIAGLREKCSGHGERPRPGSIVLHGVSMGEVALMRPVVDALRAAGLSCTIATSTTTGLESARRLYGSDCCIRLLPFDLPWAVARFLREVKPRAMILMELELWPLLLGYCHQRDIPIMLLNGRVSERSFRAYQRFLPFIRPLLSPLRLCTAQTPHWAQRLRLLGAPAEAIGSLKADMVRPAEASIVAAERARLQLDRRPLLLLASTSDPEEEPLLRSWQRWDPDQRWRVVCCPRHPERGTELAALCERLGITATRTGEHPDVPPITPDHPCIIVDEIGRLAALYALADIAVVGGSMASGRRGQNMLEAAAAGTCTVVGWDTRNQPDAMALLRSQQAVVELDPDSIDTQLAALANDPGARRELGERAQAAWASGGGALPATLQRLAGALNCPALAHQRDT